jgi:exopolysaccharide biosynthesis polyprenyl glycosylphosphotransferase
MAVSDSAMRRLASHWSVASRRAGTGRMWQRAYVDRVMIVDACAGGVAGAIAHLVWFSGVGAYNYLATSLACPALWLAAVALAGGYEERIIGLGSEEFQRIFRALVGLTATVAFISYAAKLDVARGYVLVAIPGAAGFSLMGHYAARKLLHRQRRRGIGMHRVVAVGGERAVLDLIVRLHEEWHCGMRVVGACVLSGDPARVIEHGVPTLGTLEDISAAVQEADADTVAVAAGADVDPTRLRRLAWELEPTDTDLVVAPGLIEVAGPRLHIRPVTGLPLLHVEKPEFAGPRRLLKEIVDRTIAAAALVLLSPVLLVIAISVRLTSSGPVIFRQVRVGQGGRDFTMLKFRTMWVDAHQHRDALAVHNDCAEGPLFKIKNDPRVTRVGHVLRRYSLDELPQLVNVLTGGMALVGPRPPLPEEVARYGVDVWRRLLVKPGLTGLWQISGRSDLSWDESVRLDLRYVENWSLALDLMIMWKTVWAIVRCRGAY